MHTCKLSPPLHENRAEVGSETIRSMPHVPKHSHMQHSPCSDYNAQAKPFRCHGALESTKQMAAARLSDFKNILKLAASKQHAECESVTMESLKGTLKQFATGKAAVESLLAGAGWQGIHLQSHIPALKGPMALGVLFAFPLVLSFQSTTCQTQV